jgi:hypothetical protein
MKHFNVPVKPHSLLIDNGDCIVFGQLTEIKIVRKNCSKLGEVR